MQILLIFEGMNTPPYLSPGDKVRIVSTARKISKAEVRPAVTLLEQWGLEVELGQHLFDEADQYAGSDINRLADLNDAIEDPDVKAVIAARGGYGTIRIVDGVNFEAIMEQPKWVVGYSDLTVMHAHLNACCGIESLHATMPVNIGESMEEHAAIASLKNALFGQLQQHECAPHPMNRQGKATGELFGGNLSILYSLVGSTSLPSTRGKILFIEDLDEYLYHIDRMLVSLKRAGLLRPISGLIVGGMSDMNDNTVPFGKHALEIIDEAVAEYDFPVCYDFPAGHIDDNRALIMGRRCTLDVNDLETRLKFST